MSLFQEFIDRGLLAQTTDAEAIRDLIDNKKITFYIGFDPTADSLHIGHFMQMKIMAHMQRAGHRPIAIFGGGTAMVGDPSGKSDMRKMMTKETIAANIECFKKQMSHFIDTSEGKALFINNGDWLLNLNYIDFLREVGTCFSVNRMLTAECYRSRMETGLTFLEFNYMLMQSYDFYRLNSDYSCVLQLGGDDQWSNIIGGIELIRRKRGTDAYGMTFRLLTNSEGKKMGKTEKGAIWLDPAKTSPYDFYQYWRNVGDEDVIRFMKMMTFMPLDEIEGYAHLTGSGLNEAKERLAYEITALVHGAAEADRARETARSLFGGSGASSEMPSTAVAESSLNQGKIALTELMVMGGLAPSKGEAKRLISGGGVSVGDEKISAFDHTVDGELLKGEGVIIRRGKKQYMRFYLA